jgi:hypothetical protein
MTELEVRLTREIELTPDKPWPGLAPFAEAHSRFFFGREAESEELQRLIAHGVLTSLFGRSGLGKTSLLQAGLFPRLRKDGYLPVYVRPDLNEGALPPVNQVLGRLAEEAADSGGRGSRG